MSIKNYINKISLEFGLNTEETIIKILDMIDNNGISESGFSITEAVVKTLIHYPDLFDHGVDIISKDIIFNAIKEDFDEVFVEYIKLKYF